ncbi:cupin fold metallo, WbuC family protein [Yersinia ruckeri]|uniref:WbuC family cupin fold metalloprotein n=1 Tax=Yersinia ruckeri TaxID=29486 RepID=UPI0005ACEC2E|nr:WbuC family cupin fold metalloprotein [Yersinia ruckeri]AJI95798.1 cupin fold metallo, WbuC family protein [Yersinia ruckeri]MCW6569042.1 WbuC family cupin fold metalloprotein [Yersinia ruckeri]
MKQITQPMLVQMSEHARQVSRLRSNHNFHPELDDAIQRLAIAMEPLTYVRPHRHPHTWELLTALSGHFVVLLFNDQGEVIERVLLGKEVAILEIPANTWHAVRSMEENAVIFEVKHGPYQPIIAEDFASWSPAEGNSAVANLVEWYASASVGQRYLR